MPKHADKAEKGDEAVHLPTGVVLKPAVTADDLTADTEYDPAGAEEFAALIRALRHERSRPVAL
jgi:hypothetical protein